MLTKAPSSLDIYIFPIQPFLSCCLL